MINPILERVQYIALGVIVLGIIWELILLGKRVRELEAQIRRLRRPVPPSTIRAMIDRLINAATYKSGVTEFSQFSLEALTNPREGKKINKFVAERILDMLKSLKIIKYYPEIGKGSITREGVESLRVFQPTIQAW